MWSERNAGDLGIQKHGMIKGTGEREARMKVDDDMYSDKFGMMIWVNGKQSSLRQSWIVRSLPYVRAERSSMSSHLRILS